MDNERIEQLLREYKATSPKEVIMTGDTTSLDIVSDQVKSIFRWVGQYARANRYRKGLPLESRKLIEEQFVNAINFFKQVRNMRSHDISGFALQKNDIIANINNYYSTLYRNFAQDYRSYQVASRGGEYIAGLEESAEEGKEKAQKIVQASEAASEAVAEVSASEMAKHYDDLAKKYRTSKHFWAVGFFLYNLLWLDLFLFIFQEFDELKQLVTGFDPSNTPAYALKLVIVAVYLFGLRFIAKNYNARLLIEIAAETRAVRLKTWRAFANSPEMQGADDKSQDLKADVLKKIANLLFSPIKTGLEKDEYGTLGLIAGRNKNKEAEQG